MPLAIVRGRPAAKGPAQPVPLPPETTLDRIVKLIPVDAVSVYVTLVSIQSTVNSPAFLPTAFSVCFVLVPTILYLDGRRTQTLAPALQYVLRTLAFLAWALAISEPFAAYVTIPRWIPALFVIVLPVVGERLLPPPEKS